MNWCILIPLLVGLISALLGYLLGKLGKGNTDCENCIDCQNRTKSLEADLANCKAKLASSKSTSFAAVAPLAFNAGAAKAVFGKTIKQDDLTVIEGIGPKIQDLFHNHGINTWKGLSEATVEKCQEVLNSGGERFTVHNPGTWPRQAAMAYKGDWQELLDWQDILDKGKE